MLSEDVHDHLFERVSLIGILDAVQHFAEHDALDVFQLSGLLELREHAIDLIGLGVQIFQHQDGIDGIDLVSSSQSRHNQRKTPARQTSFSRSGPQYRRSRRAETAPYRPSGCPREVADCTTVSPCRIAVATMGP